MQSSVRHIVPFNFVYKTGPYLFSKFAAARLSQTTSSLAGAQGSSGSDVAKQLNSYISAVSVGTTPPIDALDFSAQQQHQYPKLVHMHMTCCHHLQAASQAYVERSFCVCGLLTSGRRNRMSKSLEMCACLKLNSNILKETRFVL